MPDPSDVAPPKRLIIVDDQPDLLRLLLIQLKRHGYDATVCSTLDEADRALEEGRFAGALLDLYIGIQPAGLDLVARIRSHPTAADLPVVAMSASGLADLARFIAAGADVALPKPFILPEVLDALARATALRQEGGGPPAASFSEGGGRRSAR